ncbi:hypothetical protein [Vibrio sp. 1180_3]|nr:hypothetical protein [Vibrio sp. 1180_3]
MEQNSEKWEVAIERISVLAKSGISLLSTYSGGKTARVWSF